MGKFIKLKKLLYYDVLTNKKFWRYIIFRNVEKIQINERLQDLYFVFFNLTGYIWVITGGGALKLKWGWDNKLSYVCSKFRVYIASDKAIMTSQSRL